jgi:RNA polymerase sigma-70 factor, ECF subfamily
MERTDTRLLARVRNPADSRSWREFVQLYHPLLLSYVRRAGLNDHDAQDVVQEVFIKLVQGLPRFELRRERGRFRTWLYDIVRNAVVDWARRQRRFRKAVEAARGLEPNLEALDSPRSREQWELDYRQHIVGTALERVRQRCRPTAWACFEEHVLQARPAAEVASKHHLTANQVYVNASRVLTRIREQCAEFAETLGERDPRLPA